MFGALENISQEDILNPDDYTNDLRQANPSASSDELRQLLWAEMERQRAERFAAKRSFALETNFTYHDKLELLDSARQSGYETVIFFVGLDSPQRAIRRVATRVSRGGHSIENDKVIKRWSAGLIALDKAIPKADAIYVIDNSIDYDSEKQLPAAANTPTFTFANGQLEAVGGLIPLYLLRWIAHYRPEEFMKCLAALGPPNEVDVEAPR